MIEHEIWKDIPEYEGLYQISNLGRIKSLQHYRGINNILTQKTKRGYNTIGLRKKVCKYDLKGNLIATYNSITEATKLNGLKSLASISNCCNGIYETAGGNIYRFESR